MKRPALQIKEVIVLRIAFRARKVFGTFEKRAPGVVKHRYCRLLHATDTRISAVGLVCHFTSIAGDLDSLC